MTKTQLAERFALLADRFAFEMYRLTVLLDCLDWEAEREGEGYEGNTQQRFLGNPQGNF